MFTLDWNANYVELGSTIAALNLNQSEYFIKMCLNNNFLWSGVELKNEARKWCGVKLGNHCRKWSYEKEFTSRRSISEHDWRSHRSNSKSIILYWKKNFNVFIGWSIYRDTFSMYFCEVPFVPFSWITILTSDRESAIFSPFGIQLVYWYETITSKWFNLQ